jgi:hypothetical protein
MTVGTGTGARGHPGGQGPGLDPDITQRPGFAEAAWTLDRTSRAGFDHAGNDRGQAGRLSRARSGRAHAA